MSNAEQQPAPRAPASRRPGPRAVAAVALVVLGLCGAAIVAFPPRPTSLRSQPNWDLATLLPGIHDFPSSWNYSLRGSLHRTDPEQAPAWPVRHPPVFSPRECGPVPTLATLFDRPGYAAVVHVDHQTDQIARAVLQASDEPDPNARFVIYPVTDGAALITKYVDWLNHCGAYHVTAADPVSGADEPRVVTTTIGARSAAGADAALEVTRSTTITAKGPLRTTVYHVSYYWVRGVLLECATNLSGPDLDVVNHVGTRTLQKLRAA
jgi:hypothetical protein